MFYPGDTKVFLLSILGTTPGANPSVTSGPLITILESTTGAVLVAGANMTLLSGTQKTYSYPWHTTGVAIGTYLAVVSYISDSVTYNSRFLESVVLGDSRITGPVALDATVAHEATTAKDASVMHLSDYQSLSQNTTLLSIKAKTDLLPNDPASVSGMATLISNMTDVHDYCMGSWYLDTTANTLTLRRSDGTTLQVFNIVVTSGHSNRIATL